MTDPLHALPRSAVAPTLAGAFHLPTRVRFGRGVRAALGDAVAGRPCLIVTSEAGRERWLADDELGPALRGLDGPWLDGVPANPTADVLDTLVARAREEGWREGCLVAIGGGSVLDAAKAIAAGLACPGESVAEVALLASLLDDRTVAPIVALPTTAGSGSEVTSVSVVWHRDPGGGPRQADDGPAKASLAHPRLFPEVALVDPALTDTLPHQQTLATGSDAMVQAAESLWHRQGSALTLPLALRAMTLVYRALPTALTEPDDERARDALAEASLLAGVALSQTGTVACHALSYPLTDRYGISHGVACAFTLAPVMQHMLAADDGRLAALTHAMLGPDADHGALPAALARFLAQLGVGAQVRAALGSREALLALLPEVVLPERGGKGLRDLDQADRERIVAAAWEDAANA